MTQPAVTTVIPPTCPGFRHVAHPGWTCDEEDAIRVRVAAHLGPQTTIPASALAGTTFGPDATRTV